MTFFQAISASASPEVQMNNNNISLEHQFVYGKRMAAVGGVAGSSGLTWAYWGGRWGGFAVANGTLTLANNDTNYIVVARSTGVISVSATATNWNDTTNYAKVYKVPTSSGNIVSASVEDHRAGPGGVHGSSGSSTPTAGRHMIFVAAAAMRPRISNGCGPLIGVEVTADRPNIAGLAFDSSAAEFAQFFIEMPKSWDAGTVTFQPVWRHAATTTNFGVCWKLQGVAVGDDDTIDAAFGTAQSSVDTGGTTDDKYVGPESPAITLAGSPIKQDGVWFQVSRDPSDGGDTLAIDADLLGIRLYINTDADTDA